MQSEVKALWQKNKWILYLGIAVIIAAFFLDRCNNSEPYSGTKTTSVKITTEEVKGSFQPQKPVHTPITDQVTGQVPGKYHGSTGQVNNAEQLKYLAELEAENEQLSRAYYLQNDSIKKALYDKAIHLNKFSQTFDDDKVKIDVSGISRGTIESIKANYTIKQQTFTVDVPVKEKVFTLRAGGEYGNTIELNKSVFKGNLEFENKKGIPSVMDMIQINGIGWVINTLYSV